MPEEDQFNAAFYAEREKELVKSIQDDVGCFHCRRNDGVKHKGCTGCRFTMYCDRKCQAKHWKARHKKDCELICLTREESPNNLPRIYSKLGYMDQEKLVSEMEIYGNLFMDEVTRALSSDEHAAMSLVVLCAEDDCDTVRLTASARFLDAEFNIVNVHGVIFKTIDHGRDAIDRIYPPDGSHGSIADDKKALAVSYIENFVDRLKDKGIRVTMMTCGRGLTWLSRNTAEVGEKLQCISRMAG